MPSTPVVVLDSTLTNIADAIRGKNGSSDTYKPSEMPAAITAIPSGGGGGEGIPREVDANGVYGMPTQSFTLSLPADATGVGPYVFSTAFYGCTTLTSVDLSSLTTASWNSAFSNAFYNCTGLISVDLGSLSVVSANYTFNHAFDGCTSLASVDFSSLTTVAASSAFSSAFRGCTSLTYVDLSSLTTVSDSYVFSEAFRGCTSLTSVNLSSLTAVSSYGAFNSAFNGCTSLTSLSFPALTASSFGSSTNQFYRMLIGCSNVTVHFPAAIQGTIGSWSDVTSGFGGTNTTVLFDL